MKFKGIPIDQISIFKHPLVYLQLLAHVIVDGFKAIKNIIVTKSIIILITIAIWVILCKVQALENVYGFVVFALYWIVLGVASSIGLGTGLHTFVLYLGPHIAKVAMIASSCGYLPDLLPTRWTFDHFGQCKPNSTQTISFFGILLAVQLESFFWGFGTALGQLPPYFAAYKASKTKYELEKMNQQSQRHALNKKKSQQAEPLCAKQQGQQSSSQSIHVPKISEQQLQNQQISEIQVLRHKGNLTFIQKCKIIIFDNMQKYGFITILLCASIPNPLFDLAGITCGHFRIPFKKFFIPTFIGKAIIKVHIQMVFVIMVFRKEIVEKLLGWIGGFSLDMAKTIQDGFEKQKTVLFKPATFDDSKPLVGMLWDLLLTLMITYFLFSIITGLVQEKAIQLKDSEHHLQQAQKKK